jgi:hypothetical protein
MLNRQQIQWAASHDWFVCDNGDGTITVLDDEATLVWTDSFTALRNWAGY